MYVPLTFQVIATLLKESQGSTYECDCEAYVTTKLTLLSFLVNNIICFHHSSSSVLLVYNHFCLPNYKM